MGAGKTVVRTAVGAGVGGLIAGPLGAWIGGAIAALGGESDGGRARTTSSSRGRWVWCQGCGGNGSWYSARTRTHYNPCGDCRGKRKKWETLD